MIRYEFSLLDLVPYVIFILVTLLIGNSRASSSRKAKILFIFLMVFSCIRYGVGYDYLEYKYLIESGRSDYSYERFEPLSRVLVSIARFTHYQLFFIFGSILTITPVYYVIKKTSIDPYLSMLVYALHPLFFLSGLGFVRNAIAFSVVFFAGYLLIEKNKYLWSFLLIMIAYNFHSSSLIALLLYPLYLFHSSRNLNVLIYLMSFGFSIFLPTLLFVIMGDSSLYSAFEHYTEEIESGGGGTMTYVINAINIIFLYYWNKIAILDKKNEFYLRCFNFSVILWNVFQPISYTFAERLPLFFSMFSLMLYPCLVQSVRNKLTTRTYLKIFFVLFFVSSFFLSIKSHLINHSDMANLPYQTIFNHNDFSNFERWK